MYSFVKNQKLVYYKNKIQLTHEEFVKQSTELPGYVEGVLDIYYNKITITYINSNVKGNGILLLKTILNHAFLIGIDTVYLDDMSDRFGKKNNIYLKIGMKYIEEGYPEMKGYIKEMSLDLNSFVNR
jgi:hypothetical protein